MSHKFLLATAAGALLLAAPTLAATAATQPVHHAQSKAAAKTKMAGSKMAASRTMKAKTATTKTATTKTASAKTASNESAKTSAKAVHHHKMARTEHRKKTAENVSVQGNREVDALNTLESAGYRQFDNLHANGANFVATAMKSGKSFDVTVTPAGQIEATKA